MDKYGHYNLGWCCLILIMKNKTFLFLFILLSFGFLVVQAQDKNKATATPTPLPSTVNASKEQSLEVGNILLTIQAKQQEARALKAEAVIAENEATKLNEKVPLLLDRIMDALKIDKSRYTATIEEGRLFFVLK